MTQRIKNKSDAAIQSDVLQELRWDTRVKETDVGVAVDRGTVTLTGTVDSWAARLAARKAAHRVEGVLDVADDIHVKLPTSAERTDTDLAHSVRAALESDVFVPSDRIQTTVTDGIVRLEGRVDYWTQHDDAARAVRNLAGVREVKNMLLVAPPSVAEEKVHCAIEEALTRHAAHVAKHVKVSVTDDGTVTLTGEVPSWPDRIAIEGAARGTSGVSSIDNRLLLRM